MADLPIVVTNSGPLIALATIEKLDLLGSLFGTVLVPDAVFQEVTWLGKERPGAAELSQAQWVQRVILEVKPDSLLLEDLGIGEAEAISLAVQKQAALLLLDDRRARRIAEIAYHLRVKGVAGLLVTAKRKGLLDTVRPLLERLRTNGYFLSQAVIDRAVKEAGEG